MSKRVPLFAANWKMYKTPADARAYVEAFAEPAKRFADRTSVALVAPFVDLPALKGALERARSAVAVGAQDCYWEVEGAFTGEVSAAMLGAMKISYCIVGHSERRRLFGETDEGVAKKTSALIAAGVTPIVCVGETLDENRAGRTRERVTQQIIAGLGHLTDAQRRDVIVAYEPVWAIGTGLADDPNTSGETIGYIRSALDGLDEARILYGGSMKPQNAFDFCCQPNIDGGLVGSASLSAEGFCELIDQGLRAYAGR